MRRAVLVPRPCFCCMTHARAARRFVRNFGRSGGRPGRRVVKLMRSDHSAAWTLTRSCNLSRWGRAARMVRAGNFYCRTRARK